MNTRGEASSAKHSAWFKWLFWTTASISALLVFLALVIGTLWLLMPLWFQQSIIKHSPWFPPIYYACEQSRYIPDEAYEAMIAGTVEEKAAVEFLAHQLERTNAPQNGFVAFFVLLYLTSKPDLAGMDAGLKDPLIEALAANLDHSDVHVAVTNSWALALLKPRKHLPQLIALWSRAPIGDLKDVTAAIGDFDEPATCSLLLERYRQNPDSSELLDALVNQSDPRAAELLLGILRTPEHAMLPFLLERLKWRSPKNPFMLSEIKALCRHPDSAIFINAFDCLQSNPDGVEYLLELRQDPTAGANIQINADSRLNELGSLTQEQRLRWKMMPPIKIPDPAPP